MEIRITANDGCKLSNKGKEFSLGIITNLLLMLLLGSRPSLLKSTGKATRIFN